MQNTEFRFVHRLKIGYLRELRLDREQSFREGVVIAALLSQSALQLIMTFVDRANTLSPDILENSVDIQWRAVEEVWNLETLNKFSFENLYSAIFKEGDDIVENAIETFPNVDSIDSSIGCILEAHMFLLKPECIRLVKALDAFFHQSTMLAVDRLTTEGQEVSGLITPEKEVKVDNAREVTAYIELVKWVFKESSKSIIALEDVKRLRSACKERTNAVINEAESIFIKATNRG